MRLFLECYACFLRQALNAARLAGADELQQKTILDGVLDILKTLDPAWTPPDIAHRVHRLVRQVTGRTDPYAGAKRASTQEALALYPAMRTHLADAADPLETAVRLSIAGNIIDFAIPDRPELAETVERVLAQPYAHCDLGEFKAALSTAQGVLYLADNAGETIFDRLLIETLALPVTYAVKGGPILNDATAEDAQDAGIDQIATLISTGSDAPGTLLGDCSAEFREHYAHADMIIAKGQANYESLSSEPRGIFFLLQTKCPVIARDLGTSVGDIVLKRGPA